MVNQKYKTVVKDRSDLLTLLTEACELEHGLACSYLYAAFSLKQELDEGGMDWRQLHLVRKWAAQIYLVASQEMFHLSQAWNLLSALGGSPYYLRPNFPQNNKYYPIHVPLALEPFSETTIERFMQYELPQDMEELNIENSEMKLGGAPFVYKTVGGLYKMISDGIEMLSKNGTNLFIGDQRLQLGQEEIDFPEIVKVIDNHTAQEAIKRIMEQGEGLPNHHENCHYTIFGDMLKEYKAEKQIAGFEPVRNSIHNPVVYPKGDQPSDLITPIKDIYTIEVADLFDDTYNLMLRCLQFVFGSLSVSSEEKKRLSRFSIGLMPMIIKPLGDILMKLPAGEDYPDKVAGPAFTMSRHVILPDSFDVAIVVIKECFAGLDERCAILSKQSANNKGLLAVSENFKRLNTYLYEKN